MDLSGNSVTTFESGVEFEEKTFLWKIKNFPVVIQNDALINLQKMNFIAGDTVLLPSEWTVYLQTRTENDGKWVSIFHQLKKAPTADITELYTFFDVTLKDKDGNKVWDGAVTVKDMMSLKPNSGWGFFKMIKRDSPLPFLVGDDLFIHVHFKIYAKSNPSQPVEEALQQFHVKAAAKAWRDFAELLQSPAPSSDTVKMISNDGKEFIVQKGVLAARNPVFRAMLESNMVEAKNRVIRLPDLSSESLRILIHYFARGELLPDWTQHRVIVELTNAAAQYHIEDLLQFLDVVLGKVCTLDNVAQLLALAARLSLNTAEEALMGYVRKEVTASSGNYFQTLKAASVEDFPDGSKKRSHSGGDNEKDLAGAFQHPEDGNEIQIIKSNEGKAFPLIKRVLAAQSPEFESMLRSDRIEARSCDPIELPDVSSKTLQILLNFVCTGELQPEWKDSEVVVELKNAAAKYQLSDLVEFLDGTLDVGMADLDNMGALMMLAHQLSLKRATTGSGSIKTPSQQKKRKLPALLGSYFGMFGNGPASTSKKDA